ncbi:MAG TPA: carboxypeptidase regulatory-like domain-containing protein [Bacteroidota bacterium]
MQCIASTANSNYDGTSRIPSCLLLLLIILLVPVFLRSQTSSSTFLQGNIIAIDGSGLPCAHVELLHVPTGTVYRVAAGDDGHYLIAGVRVGGPYTLKISHIGFGTQIRAGLFLRSYENARVDVALYQVNLPQEEVVVTGARKSILRNQSVGPSLRVDKEQLEALPNMSGSLEDAHRLSPYMVGQSALGSNRLYNDLSLDGIGIGDEFGLQHAETIPGGMQGSPVTMESIQEVRVDLSPFDVQRSGFTGAAITALTRSGSQVFTGSLYGQAAGGRWVGRNPDDGRSDLRGFADDRAGFRIGGPIIKSRAFYFVAAEFSRVRVPIERQFGAPTTGGSTFSFSPAAINQFLTVLDTVHGYDPGRMDIVSLERQSANVFARFDLNLLRGQRLSVRYNLLASRSDRPPYGTTVFAEGTLARNLNTAHSIVASLNSIIRSSMANELLIGYTRRQFTSTPLGTPFPYVDVTELDRLQWWNHLTVGSEIGGNGNRALEDHLELRNGTSLSLGSHILTGGVQGDMHWFKTQLLSDQWGHYTFASRADFMRGQPSEYEYRYASTPGGDYGSRWRALQFGAFLQDEWALSSVLSMSVGLRADVPMFPDRPKDNSTGHEAFLPAGYDISTTRVPAARVALSPRIGFSINPKTDHPVQVRGGFGVFTGRIPYAWIDNLYNHTGLDYVHIKESAFAPKFVADPSAQPVPGPANRLRETMEIVAITPNFVLPQEARWTLAFDLALPWNLVVSFESVFSRTLNGVVFRNINLRVIDTMKYSGPEILSPPGGDEREILGRNDPRFTDAILMTNATVGATTFYTIQIQRRPEGNGLFASLAYSAGSTKDINSGTWDNAYDQWRHNPALQPNEPGLGFSAFDRSHRITAALSYQYEWSPGFPATFGMVYTGISGTPFSYVYDGDLNGDGESLNDLFYIPRPGRFMEIVLWGDLGQGLTGRLPISDPAYNQLFKFIAGDEYLSTHVGRVAERNGARTPWVHQLDMRIAQCVPLVGSSRLEVSAEVLNILNLLNPSWGLVQTVPNQVVPVLQTLGVGSTMFRWAPRTSPWVPEPLLSRWRLRVGVRYSF